MKKFVKTGRYVCHWEDGSDRREIFETLEAAHATARRVCGNGFYLKPFPSEETFLYGPGDGTTLVMIRSEYSFGEAVG